MIPCSGSKRVLWIDRPFMDLQMTHIVSNQQTGFFVSASFAARFRATHASRNRKTSALSSLIVQSS